MPKLKTHSGTKKRFRSTASGLLLAGPARKRHGLTKRSQDMKRQARGTFVLCSSDAKIVTRNFVPNGLK